MQFKIDIVFRLCILCMVSQTIVYTASIKDVNAEVQLAMDILNAAKYSRHKREPTATSLLEDKYADLLSSGDIPESIVCPKFRKPDNGIMRCGGRMCLIQCNTGFIQIEQHAFVYTCDETTKQWTSIPKDKMIPWPDCEKNPFELENKK